MMNNNRQTRAQEARKHTERMERVYADKIAASVRQTKRYDTDFACKKAVADRNMNIRVEALDTVYAGMRYHRAGSRMALLNFASYKHPGGGFLSGSRAQEECLCHESFLYNVLAQFDDFYAWNNEHANHALYLDRGLYTPDVMFWHGEVSFCCDVITCAAPNRSAAQMYQRVTDTQNRLALKSRLRFVLDIAKDNGVDTLILGAFGCGVFGQEAAEVADIFREYLNTTHRCFDTVVFAVPEGRDGNLKAFRAVFGNS